MATRIPRNGPNSDELLDRLLAGRGPAEAFRSGELIDDLKKAVAERALDAEMDVHLSGEEEQASGNHRNGHDRKRVLTEGGAMDLQVPRARQDGFELRLPGSVARGLQPLGEVIGHGLAVETGKAGDRGYAQPLTDQIVDHDYLPQNDHPHLPWRRTRGHRTPIAGLSPAPPRGRWRQPGVTRSGDFSIGTCGEY